MADDIYLHFDGMTWPNPYDPAGIEWVLRYAVPTKEQLMVAASFVAAYKQLVYDPQRTRNAQVSAIRRAAYDHTKTDSGTSPEASVSAPGGDADKISNEEGV